MNNPTFKKFLTMSVALATTTDEFAEDSLIIVTHSGIIEGRYGEGSLLSSFSKGVKDKFDEAYPSDLSGNDGHIILKNATLTTATGQFNFQELIVFYDQIVGVTLGQATRHLD